MIRRTSQIFAFAFLFTAQMGAANAISPCGKTDQEAFVRLADLPPEAKDAIGVKMADKGEPFQMGDVISRPGLPLYRFLSATRSRCQIKVEFEQGGFLHRVGTIILTRTEGKWRRAEHN